MIDAYKMMVNDVCNIVDDEQVNMGDYGLDWCKMVVKRLNKVYDEYVEMVKADEYFPMERNMLLLGDFHYIYESVVGVVDRAPKFSRTRIDWKVMNSIRDRMEEFMGK